MKAKQMDQTNHPENKGASRENKSPKASPMAMLSDVLHTDSGNPGGGQGRIDFSGSIPGNVYIDPFFTEGHSGYEESGQSEITPPVDVAGDMKVKDAIYTRRSVRDYADKEVSKQTVMVLLQAATQAPSAVNQQPWTFVVIQNRSLLKSYSDKAKQLYSRDVKLDSLPDAAKKMISDPSFDIFHNAGTLIVVCAKPIGLHPDWDCCFAAQNLMLMAHAMDLATCPIGFAWPLMNETNVRQELQIPSDYVSVLPIAVGYPSKAVTSVCKKNAEILCWK